MGERRRQQQVRFLAAWQGFFLAKTAMLQSVHNSVDGQNSCCQLHMAGTHIPTRNPPVSNPPNTPQLNKLTVFSVLLPATTGSMWPTTTT
jgi:hypothetical protein